jgi:hypothetical protein
LCHLQGGRDIQPSRDEHQLVESRALYKRGRTIHDISLQQQQNLYHC